MAQQTTITLIDDIDGESAATETVIFALDGKSYEIDLNDAHAAELRAALTPFIDKARRSGRAAAGSGRRRAAAGGSGPSAEDIRAWAKSKKLKVSERGRISAEIRQAYDDAH